jgi:hypothetical protein
MNIFTRLFNWFRQFFAEHHFKKIRFVSRISEIPDEIGKDAYIVERNGRKLWLVFNCPCDLGHRLTVNLSQEREPFWTVRIRNRELNVSPSIWIGDECHSHFWIRNGDIFHTRDYIEGT